MSSPVVGFHFRRKVLDTQPSDAALARIRVHAVQIRRRLESSFAVNRIEVIGSHAKGTAIRTSDLDLMTAMSRDEARKWARDGSSRTLINRVGNDLRARFPATTIRRDGQAIVVGFRQGEAAVDVVPAVFGRFDSAPNFLIPDGAGGWIETSPAAQRKHLEEADTKSGGRLVPLIRLLKWWAASRSATAPARSFYFELAAPLCGIGVGASYSQSVATVFRRLLESNLPPISDPTGLSHASVAIAATERQRAAVREALEQSLDRAERALAAEMHGRAEEALRLWTLVFNYA